MKKMFLAIILASGFGGYIYWNSRNAAPVVTNASADTIATEPASSSALAVSIDSSNNVVGTAPVSTKYKDGTYAGDIASTIYGDVQVAAVIRGGKIADVKMLKYPNDRENSARISSQSLPILKQEAISSQSAQVDIVSGATQTAEGFQQSLDSALSQAQV